MLLKSVPKILNRILNQKLQPGVKKINKTDCSIIITEQ